MTPARPACGVVTLAALDLRRHPAHTSEMKSQLLLGETVRIERASRDGQWLWVRNDTDGYQGWIRSWGIVPCSAARARRWRERARGLVASAYAEIRAGRGAGALVSPVFWNGRLIAGPVRAGYRSAELPDGRRGWIAAAAMRTPQTRPPDLVARVRSLLGVPYLWGGRTPLGIDCSALVQLLLLEQGISLPRDAHDQYRASISLPLDRPAEFGDLLFFGVPRRRLAHVGLAVGGGYFVHARGRVLIGSADPDNPMCDRELLAQLRARHKPPATPNRGSWFVQNAGDSA